MLTLKAITVAVAGVLTILAVRQIMNQIEAAKARVRTNTGQRPVTRLRQDPRTGVYYPEA
jgi:outer membrane lipoprotein SlyB